MSSGGRQTRSRNSSAETSTRTKSFKRPPERYNEYWSLDVSNDGIRRPYDGSGQTMYPNNADLTTGTDYYGDLARFPTLPENTGSPFSSILNTDTALSSFDNSNATQPSYSSCPILQSQSSPFHTPQMALSGYGMSSSTGRHGHRESAEPSYSRERKDDQAHSQRSQQWSKYSPQQNYNQELSQSYTGVTMGVKNYEASASTSYYSPAKGAEAALVGLAYSNAAIPWTPSGNSPQFHHPGRANQPPTIVVDESDNDSWLQQPYQSNALERSSEHRQYRGYPQSGPYTGSRTGHCASDLKAGHHYASNSSAQTRPCRTRERPCEEDMVKEEPDEDEYKLRVPRDPNRRSKGRSSHGRTRDLTPEGREHAKGVRRLGACERCHKRKIKVRVLLAVRFLAATLDCRLVYACTP